MGEGSPHSDSSEIEPEASGMPPNPDSRYAPGNRHPSAALFDSVRRSVARVFIGQETVVNQVLAGLLAGGHVLLEGKPGLGKTHLVLALARSIDCEFGRIQFTPDLMPSDITGHSMFDMSSQTFRLRKGPVFANLLLADEINRAPAKTQAALLEVMQERQVTIDGESLPLDPPFMTLATQNPIEQEGTYPLPEAQLDRFLMKILIDYPDVDAEKEISRRAAGFGDLDPNSIEAVCKREDVVNAQKLTGEIKAVDEVVGYAVDLVRQSRETRGIDLGVGTRGAISLLRVGKAFAILDGRDYIIPDDIKSAALPVMRHRIGLAPELSISGQRVDDVIRNVIESVDAPRQ